MSGRRVDRYGRLDSEAERLALQSDWDEYEYMADLDLRWRVRHRVERDVWGPQPSDAEQTQSPESAQ